MYQRWHLIKVKIKDLSNDYLIKLHIVQQQLKFLSKASLFILYQFTNKITGYDTMSERNI